MATEEETLPPCMIPLPQELRQMVVVALEEAGETGITVSGLKRRCAGGKLFSRLIDKAISQMVSRGEVSVEKRSASGGGRGRPRQVLVKSGGDPDGEN